MSTPKAPGVVYFESELLPGKPMLRCDRMSASLQVTRCASMWVEANESRVSPERVGRCQGCAIGAAHAGAKDPNYHRLRGSPTCARCQRTGLRLIGGNVCVSCKNREYEWGKGRNARGRFPVMHPDLARRQIVVLAGGVVRVVARELTAGTMELVVEVLRDSPDRVVFGLGRGRVHGAN